MIAIEKKEIKEDDMSHSNQPPIVAPGPVGLGTALFFARHGRSVRIVETYDEPSQQSRA